MDFDIMQVNQEQREVLANLMQFYIYDFSEYIKFDVEEDGRYNPYPLEDYWKDVNHRFAYIIKQENKYVGFVLVRFIETDERSYYSIVEFFILKKYRREAIGKGAAAHIFNLHRGPWEVHQIESNRSAQKFWHEVIDEYTQGQFKERIEEEKTIQNFVS
ncbi:GNAT family N-acetyltransferase [Paenibacillus wulumuqiensis]|uniref:GNAT family N-acetyltransferase n=1 Tax=Paenibacillus wulumuqiensis TaxID=1567107 RepID=UPI0006194AEC|nr:GNAT family N-acetyltransferase [Paenibacillus wulumuqiensis]